MIKSIYLSIHTTLYFSEYHFLNGNSGLPIFAVQKDRSSRNWSRETLDPGWLNGNERKILFPKITLFQSFGSTSVTAFLGKKNKKQQPDT